MSRSQADIEATKAAVDDILSEVWGTKAVARQAALDAERMSRTPQTTFPVTLERRVRVMTEAVAMRQRVFAEGTELDGTDPYLEKLKADLRKLEAEKAVQSE